MVFRVCISAALLFLVAILVASAPRTPAQAGSSDISYNELTKIVMGQSAPAPGSYSKGSFDADWQSAQPGKQSNTHGLFGAFNAMKNALNSLSTGTPSTYYYLTNMEREDDITGQTGTITLPDKGQYIHLDFANKTYSITSPHTAEQYIPPQTQQQPGPQGPQPSPQPGTSKVAITVSTTSLGSKNLGGVDTDGYQLTFKIVSSQATGSCINGTFQTTMTEFVSKYAEPSIHWPMAAKLPHMAMPKFSNPETASFKPGCTPKTTTRVHIGPTAPSGRLVIWELLTINASGQAQQGSMAGGFSTLIERGDVKQLGGGDSSLFGPPPGFTLTTNTP